MVEIFCQGGTRVVWGLASTLSTVCLHLALQECARPLYKVARPREDGFYFLFIERGRFPVIAHADAGQRRGVTTGSSLCEAARR